MDSLAAPAPRRIAPAGPRMVVIHAHGGWGRSIETGQHVFFRKLLRQATTSGMTTRIVQGGGPTSRMLMEQDHVQLSVGGPAGFGPNLLHAAPGPVWGFWYLDEVGTGWQSSLRFARFCPDEVDGDKAQYFFDGVTGHMLRENVSTRPQAPRGTVTPEPAGAAVFCQLPETPREKGRDRSHYLTTEQMIRTAATALPGRRVLVKPHPDAPKLARKALFDIARDHPNVTVTDASVHDIVQAAPVIVTRNSAAGFEALMQRRCVITCGKSDFWHATLTPRTEEDLREALLYGAESMRDFPYERYLYWFLGRMCLEPAKADFTRRAWGRVRDKALL